MNLDTVKAALNILLVLYLVGFPIWTLLAYALGRNHADSSILVIIVLFIIAIGMYVFAITFELPIHDKHGKTWVALFLLTFETITIAIAMLIGAIRTFTKRVEDIDG